MVDRCISSPQESAFKLTILIFVEIAKCAALQIEILLACDEVLGQVLLQACGHWFDLRWSVANSLSSNTSHTLDISRCRITEMIS